MHSCCRFDWIVSLFVVASGIMLCLFRPTEPLNSPMNRLVEDASFFFMALFTVEVAVKLLAWGAFSRKGYLADTWNTYVAHPWCTVCAASARARTRLQAAYGAHCTRAPRLLPCSIDFVTVIVSWFTLLPSLASASSFRLIRLLRSLAMFRGPRIILQAMLHSIPQLCRIGLLVLLLVVTLGIIGTHMWAGVLAGACEYAPTTPAGSVYFPSPFQRCAPYCAPG
ncbi:MAG: ion transporter, partial [Methanobacteriota archaeon]